MRQGEVAPQGKWEGALGGVKAPDPIVLPDPAKRFATTAKRLETLADNHAMEDWLRFMARLVWAQYEALESSPAPQPADLASVEKAVEAGMPPLSADGHQRDSVWREGLTAVLDKLDTASLPPQVTAAIDDLRNRDAASVEKLADRFLHGHIEASDAGAVLFVAAGLQLYFTRMAANLPVKSLNLLEERSLCPCCGSTPSAGMVMASGATPGSRYLFCSLCSTRWNRVRAHCITCNEARSTKLEGIEGDDGVVKAETCNECQTYSKMIYQKQDMKADPYADDLATLGLDILVGEAGWSRHAPNPLVLAG